MLRLLELLHLNDRTQSDEHCHGVEYAYRRKQPRKSAVVALLAAPHRHRGACKCPVEVVGVAHHLSVPRERRAAAAVFLQRSSRLGGPAQVRG